MPLWRQQLLVHCAAEHKKPHRGGAEIAKAENKSLSVGKVHSHRRNNISLFLATQTCCWSPEPALWLRQLQDGSQAARTEEATQPGRKPLAGHGQQQPAAGRTGKRLQSSPSCSPGALFSCACSHGDVRVALPWSSASRPRGKTSVRADL